MEYKAILLLYSPTTKKLLETDYFQTPSKALDRAFEYLEMQPKYRIEIYERTRADQCFQISVLINSIDWSETDE